MPHKRIAALLCGLLVLPLAGRAELSDQETAIELINPVGRLGSVINYFEHRGYDGTLPGAGDQSRTSWLITPSIPFQLDNGKRIVLRATLPISFGTPTYITEDDDFADWHIRKVADELPTDGYFISGHGHLEDISYDIAYGGVNDNGLITMIGLAGVFPTSKDGSIERDQYLLGPEFALGKVTSWGIYGAWLKHLVSVANVSGKVIDYDTNETSVKLFFAYGLGNGWNLVSNPEILYDWEGASNNRLLLPLGGGVSKTTRLGRVPMKMDLELYYYLESPEAFGPEWQLQFTFTPAWGD